jgi:hypothetical protein
MLNPFEAGRTPACFRFQPIFLNFRLVILMKHKQNFFSAKHYYKFNYDLNVTDVCYRHRSVITCFSLYGLKSLSKGIINSYQLEFVRRKFKRRLRKKAKF